MPDFIIPQYNTTAPTHCITSAQKYEAGTRLDKAACKFTAMGNYAFHGNMLGIVPHNTCSV